MYESDDDIYCYPGTTVLKNLRNLRTQRALERFETAMTAQRFDEPLPNGLLSVRHYKAVHHHLFQDVFTWAGKSRTVRISKPGSTPFCYPEYIDGQLRQTFRKLQLNRYLRNLPANDFLRRRRLSWANSTQFIPFVMAMGGHSLRLWCCSRKEPAIRCIWIGCTLATSSKPSTAWSISSPTASAAVSSNWRSWSDVPARSCGGKDRPRSGSSTYSNTSSARASNDGGTVRPSALAALRLIMT